jgi:hypothetical protein
VTTPPPRTHRKLAGDRPLRALAGIARRNPNLGEASPPICLSFVGSQSNDPQQLTYPKGYGVI